MSGSKASEADRLGGGEQRLAGEGDADIDDHAADVLVEEAGALTLAPCPVSVLIPAAVNRLVLMGVEVYRLARWPGDDTVVEVVHERSGVGAAGVVESVP